MDVLTPAKEGRTDMPLSILRRTIMRSCFLRVYEGPYVCCVRVAALVDCVVDFRFMNTKYIFVSVKVYFYSYGGSPPSSQVKWNAGK